MVYRNIVLGEDWRKSNNEELLKRLRCIFYFLSQGMALWLERDDDGPWFVSSSIEDPERMVLFRIDLQIISKIIALKLCRTIVREL
jgi:hypothetical protein